MANLRARYGEFVAGGAEIVALSVEPPDVSRRLRAAHKLPFTLLSDLDKVVIEPWGLLNRNERGGIAYPATWLINRDLQVEYRALETSRKRADLQPVLELVRGRLGAADTAKLRRLRPHGTTLVKHIGSKIAARFRT